MPPSNEMPAEPEAAFAVLAHFAERIARDEQTTGIKPVAEYLANYPGWEPLIKEEYERFEGDGSESDVPEQAPGFGPALPGKLTGQEFGPYTLLKEIGRGGQAVVYAALHRNLHSRVALKLLASLSEDGLVRFQREGRILARLSHPALCPIAAADAIGGQPYLEMKLIEGPSLAECIATWSSGPQRNWLNHVQSVLATIEPIARGLAKAHEAGVIHRDVKPGNILIEKDTNRPYLIDFGLAGDQGDDRGLSRTQDQFGTPAYMSPEQRDGPAMELDAASDVYSLGLTLSDAISLTVPSNTPRGSVLPAHRGSSNPQHSADIDLLAVVECATAHAKSDRYPTMAEFAADLAALRSHRSVSVRRPGPLLQAKRWAKRKPAIASLAGMLSASLVAGLMISLMLLADARESDRKAQDALAISELELARASLVAARQSIEASKPVAARENLARCPKHLRGFEWRHHQAMLDSSTSTVRLPLDKLAHTIVLADSIIAIDEDQAVAIVDGKAGEAMRLTGKTLQCGRIADNRWFRITSTKDGVLAKNFEGLQETSSETLLTTPSSRVFAWQRASSWQVLDEHANVTTPTREITTELGIGTWHIATASPDNCTIAIAHNLDDGLQSEVVLVDAVSGRIRNRLTERARQITALTFSRDGKRLTTAARDPMRISNAEVACWDVRSGTELLRQTIDCREITALSEIAGATERLWIGCSKGSLRSIDIGLEVEGQPRFGHESAVLSIWKSDRGQLVTAARDNTVKSWRPDQAGLREQFRTSRTFQETLACDSNGTIWLGAQVTGIDRIDLSQGGRTTSTLAIPARSIAVGEGMISVFGPGAWHRVHGDSGNKTPSPATKWLAGIAFGTIHPNHHTLYASDMQEGSCDILVIPWDGSTQPSKLQGLRKPAIDVQASSTGDLVAATDSSGAACVWRRGRPQPIITKADSTTAVAVSPDGQWFAIGSDNGFEIHHANTPHKVSRHATASAVWCLAFSPDATRLAAGQDKSVMLFNTVSTSPLLTFDGLQGDPRRLSWDERGEMLVASDGIEWVDVWRTRVPPVTSSATAAAKPDTATIASSTWLANTARWRSPTFRFRFGAWAVAQRSDLPADWYQVALESAKANNSQKLIGACQFRLGRIREAIATLAPLFDGVAPTNDTSAAFLAMALFQDNQPDRAASTLQRLQLRNPHSALHDECRAMLNGSKPKTHEREGPVDEAMLRFFSWTTCLQSDLSRTDYQNARAWALSANSLRPTHGHQVIAAANSLRSGDASALNELRNLSGQEHSRGRDAFPATLAFHALAEHRAGNHDRAHAVYQRFLVTSLQQRYVLDRPTTQLRQELQRLFEDR